MSANQTFDLMADAIMIAFVAPTLVFVDFGSRAEIFRLVMVLYVLIFITWSAMSNRS
jgi:hypothetical protein